MYINLYLPRFNYAYLFFLFSFSLNIFVSFIFIALFPKWHLVLFSFLCFSLFLTSRYNFWSPLFARSIYCTLCLLNCFEFADGCICICVYLVTLFIVVINLYIYIGLLQFSGVPPPLFSPFFFVYVCIWQM